MFKPINKRVNEPAIRELLECAVLFDPDALETAACLYREEDTYKLYGYEEEGGIAGIIGFRVNTSDTLEIEHLAVHPEQRMKGFGRALVLLALTEAGPERVEALTDEEGADFFRSIGFQITGFQDEASGEERFRCIYEVENDED
ncbi:GNAT family N-acetyltransferase [Paenibacillus sp. MBLB2552]|uniref:GNAT family N-acetyltransferase n=1 Tax=Paenibacillus mellifer TaxID=2937794 RepID=A0A9X1Y0Z4_9BACL|nr:GNAT family N-acetyltransferase [Paenibacillus mellifer]MCK8487631.1 GNAT family N-acetyltransferase [Paenibacillus mellifer]